MEEYDTVEDDSDDTNDPEDLTEVADEVDVNPQIDSERIEEPEEMYRNPQMRNHGQACGRRKYQSG